MIALQWFLVGAFPLSQPRNWWAEPGAFITVCTVIAFGILLIRPINDLARLPARLAMFAWFWWFALLVWKSIRFTWRRVTTKPA